MKRTKVAGGYRALEGDIVGSADDAESLEGLARRRPAESAQVLHYGAAHSGLEGAHAAAEHGGMDVSAEDTAVVVVEEKVVVSDDYTAVIDDAGPNARLRFPSHAHAEVRRLVSQSALALPIPIPLSPRAWHGRSRRPHTPLALPILCAGRTFAVSVWTPATTDTRQIDIPSIPSPCLTPPSPTSPPARSAAAPSRTLSPANTPSTCTRGYVQFDEVHGWL